MRSLLETVACQHIISRRKLLDDLTQLRQAYTQSQVLFARLQDMRQALTPVKNWVREDGMGYDYNTEGAEKGPDVELHQRNEHNNE